MIPCILCMTMMVLMVIFEKDQEQSHQDTMTLPGAAFSNLKTQKLVKDGYDLFLTSNGVILIYDDLPCDYFEIVGQFPYVGYNFASRTSGHSLPPEIKIGAWRKEMTAREKYEEYLPPGEISQYLEDGMLVEFRVPRTPFPKRRSTAWEFMSQEVPEKYLQLLNNFPEERRYPAACSDGRYGTSSLA